MKTETKQRIEQIRHGNVPEGYQKTKAWDLSLPIGMCTCSEIALAVWLHWRSVLPNSL